MPVDLDESCPTVGTAAVARGGDDARQDLVGPPADAEVAGDGVDRPAAQDGERRQPLAPVRAHQLRQRRQIGAVAAAAATSSTPSSAKRRATTASSAGVRVTTTSAPSATRAQARRQPRIAPHAERVRD